MAIPKVVGIETEYGLAVRGGHASLDTSRDFLHGVLADMAVRPVPWCAIDEIPGRDARDPHRVNVGFLAAGKSARDPCLGSSGYGIGRTSGSQAIDIRIEHDLGVLLHNGARFYIDHAHPEYCTPECLTARELVAHDKAGEYFLLEALERYNATRASDREVLLFKNNSDHQGHSYGCHENFLMAADAYEDLFNNKAHRLYAYLLPYLVTRQVFCGAGKVGSETGDQSTDFQISQRADFFIRAIGLQTMSDRPIINTRDEPHADPGRFRRLHVICGDANLAPWSTYLKVAITQLILTMLEDDALRLGTDVMLADPVKAIKVISADPELKASVELEGGCRKASAIAIQRIFLEAAQAYLETAPQAEERWGQVWTDWHDVIHRLETEPQALDRRLDWRIKWQFLKDQAARRDIGWQHPTTRELDMRYHQLDRQKGFYYLLHEAGFVEDLIPDDDIRQALSFPPDSTRAYLRGGLAAKHHLRIIAANWEVLSLALSDSSGTRSIEVYLPDPLTPSRTTVTEIPDDPGALKQWLSTIPGLQSTLHSINSEGEHVRTPISETATSGAAAA